MAYEVTFDLPTRQLGKTDIRFVVKTEDGVLGTLEVSKGALVWYPRKTSYGHKVTWKRFSEMVEENATQSEKRKK